MLYICSIVATPHQNVHVHCYIFGFSFVSTEFATTDVKITVQLGVFFVAMGNEICFARLKLTWERVDT